MGSAAAYEAIIEVNYEHWILENELDLTIEDFRCEIDVRYRRQHRQFPLWDDDMEDRLEEIADGFGCEFLESTISGAEQLENNTKLKRVKDQLLLHTEMFLRYKSLAEKQDYPQNRMFKRKDIWRIQQVDFRANELDEEDAYIEAFEELIEAGYFKLVERGGDHKHDIFYSVEV
ncbi:MAG: hypothetical protein HOE76_05875 [Euryarchaeota archaeon]|jgi:hypothetical protein|nr:hypothetical protein [Euryarchaeota archaeon]MBT4981816.1 hypothetical protein [Euryarchaeota archaeon]MBT5184389.1 hypothetical protein [Euryarchaeota archaeon]